MMFCLKFKICQLYNENTSFKAAFLIAVVYACLCDIHRLSFALLFHNTVRHEKTVTH